MNHIAKMISLTWQNGDELWQNFVDGDVSEELKKKKKRNN